MNMKNHCNLIRSHIKVAEEKFDAEEYKRSLELVVSAYCLCRNLIDEVYVAMNDACISAEPAGESVT